MRKAFLLIAYLIAKTTALNSHCSSYQTHTWWTNNFYQCDVTSLEILNKDDRRIDSVSGIHLYGRRHNTVDSYWLHDTTVYYFPSNLEQFYPDLIAISIVRTKLKEVHREDYAPFPKLIKVYLDDNELKYLEKDLFKFNPLLERFSASKNQIVHVDSSVFIDSSKLIYLHFKENPCISDEASNDRYKVLDLILDIQTKCYDPSVIEGRKVESFSSSNTLKMCYNTVIFMSVVKYLMNYLM